VYLSGDTNFRDNLPLPFQYKSNRTGEKPKLLEECRRYLLEKHLAKLSVNCEADDDLVTRAMMAKNSKTEKIIIASIDKDQTQAFGTYLLNWTEEKPEVRLIPDFGELQLTEDKHVKFTGRLGAYFQWIYGDRVDFYCPYDLAEGAKFGEMSAYNALKNCKDDFDALKVVHDIYKGWYPEPVTYTAWDGKEYTKNHIEIMQMYADCVFMKRSPNYKYDVKRVLKFAGVI
jgi:hypothetical protein